MSGDDESAAVRGRGAHQAPGARRDYGGWARRYLERAPVAVAVVRGAEHTLVHANAAFRRLAALRSTSVGHPVTEGFAADAAHALKALLDRVRRDGVVAREAVVSPPPAGGVSPRFTVWPVDDRNGRVDQLVVVLLESPEADDDAGLTRSRQTDIAEAACSRPRNRCWREAEASRKRGRVPLAAAFVSVPLNRKRRTPASRACPSGRGMVLVSSWDRGTMRRLASSPDPAKQELARGRERSAPSRRTFGVP